MKLPAFGVIKGGRLDRWRFHVLHFVATPRSLRLLCRCTPPAWPFPKDLPLCFLDFGQLRRIPGSRAKTLDASAMIRSAITLERLRPPEWLAEARTVRSVLQKLDCRIKPLEPLQ